MTRRPLPQIAFLPEPPPRDPSDMRCWARSVLGATDGAALDQARIELLKKLAAEEFVPPQSWQESAWVLRDEAQCIATQEEPAGYLADRRADLTSDIAAFARSFFHLEPAERLAHWRVLRDRAHEAATIARLELLRGGMAIKDEPWEVDSPLFHRIRQCIREVFVCTLTQQPNRWRRFVADMEDSPDDVYRAVQLLRLHCPEWIDVGADLLQAIRDKYPTVGIVVDTSNAPFQRLSSNWLDEVPPGELHASRKEARPSYPAGRKHTAERDGNGYPMWRWFIIPLIVLVGRAFTAMDSSSPRYTPNSQKGGRFDPGQIPRVPDLSDPAKRTFPLPTNEDGQVEVSSSRETVDDDPKAREALAKVLGIPVEKLKIKPRGGVRRDP